MNVVEAATSPSRGPRWTGASSASITAAASTISVVDGFCNTSDSPVTASPTNVAAPAAITARVYRRADDDTLTESACNGGS